MATTTTPGSFRLPGYSIAVGPFSHLAAERDRLSALDVAPLRRGAPRLDGGCGDLRGRPARAAARRGRSPSCARPSTTTRSFSSGTRPSRRSSTSRSPVASASWRSTRSCRRTPVSPSWCASRRRGGQRVRELVAPRRHLAPVPVHGCHPARGVRARARWRHALRRHVRGLRSAGRGDQGHRSTISSRCTTSPRRSGTA